jgi:acyl carrier protein
MTKPEVVLRAKELLVNGLRLDISPADIDDDAAIFGAGLGLDSIDALEFVVLVEENFGVAIPDEAVAKQAFASVDALAEFILAEGRLEASSS